jgi:tRNA1Val (adenine37-N6)-methyltransferase
VAGPGEVTHDALFDGRLPLAQLRRGYRTNVDALWLAAFAARDKPARACVDLGSGVGAVGLALAVCGAAHRVTLIDVVDDAIDLARENAAACGVGDRVEAEVIDLRAPLPGPLSHRFDLVVANPPWASREARPSPIVARAIARTGEPATLPGFVRAARAALGAAGRACFVYPTGDLPQLLSLLCRVGLEPKRLRMIHPLSDAPARAALIEAKPARPGGLRVEPPLIAMRAPGVWSDEAAQILSGSLRGRG